MLITPCLHSDISRTNILSSLFLKLDGRSCPNNSIYLSLVRAPSLECKLITSDSSLWFALFIVWYLDSTACKKNDKRKKENTESNGEQHLGEIHTETDPTWIGFRSVQMADSLWESVHTHFDRSQTHFDRSQRLV